MASAQTHDWLQTLLLLGDRLEKIKPAIAAVKQKMPGLFGLGLVDEQIWLEINRVAQTREGRDKDYRSFIDFLEKGMPPPGEDWIARAFQQMARNRFRIILTGLTVSKERVAPAQGGGRVEVTSVDHRVEVLLWLGERAREDGYAETIRQLAVGNIVKSDPMTARLLREWVEVFQNRGNPQLEWLRQNLPQVNPNQWGNDLNAWADAVEARPNLLTRPWFLWTMGIMIGLIIVIFTIIGFAA